MYRYITYEADTGMIRSWLTTNSILTEGEVMELPTPRKSDPNLYVVNGQLVARPEIDLPETLTVVVGEDVSLGVLPEGCKIYIDQNKVGVADGSEVSVSFPVSGNYQIRLAPPFPYGRKSTEVVVNEANT